MSYGTINVDEKNKIASIRENVVGTGERINKKTATPILRIHISW